MIEASFIFLAIPSMFVAPITGWMTWAFYRDGEMASARKAGAVFVVSATFLVLGHKVGPGPSYTGGNCYTDWDARSNPTVCD